MSRTTTIMSDYQKMAQQPDAASIILKLMMACNDMQTANEALSYWKEKRVQQPTGRAHGAGMYFIRLQISHLSEALKIIKKIKQNSYLLNLLNRCDGNTQNAFSQLEKVTKNTDEIHNKMIQLRSNIGFHYLETRSEEWIKKR
ncbi:MAG: hypothetical protein INF84_19130 [Roseomonas sp.]|nr:hypothetical protein [Roseomonas sp.]